MEFITKNDYIYEKLKDEIVDGVLSAGERIVIPDVAKKYGVSGMPIREALSRLQQEGLVENIPHAGARVMSFDLDKHKEIMMIRIELEPLLTKLSTPYVDAVTIDKLQALYEEMQECLTEKDELRFGKVNKKFHMLIYTSGPYQILSSLVSSLWARSEFSRRYFITFPDRLTESNAEHLELIKALKVGDAEKASQIIRQQKERALSIYIPELEKVRNSSKND